DVFGPSHIERGARALYEHPIDLRVRMLAPSYSQYQRAAQRWWSGIEPAYVKRTEPRRPPVYFVSWNTHALANLVGGSAHVHADEIVAWARLRDPEGLGDEVARIAKLDDATKLAPLLYYL